MKPEQKLIVWIKNFTKDNLKIVEELEKQLDKPSSAGVILRELDSKIESFETVFGEIK